MPMGCGRRIGHDDRALRREIVLGRKLDYRRNCISIEALICFVRKEVPATMKKKSMLAIVGLTLAMLLSVGVPTAYAGVGVSIGIPLPGVTFYAPGPPVYYSAPSYYYPPTYYAPPSYYYGPSYYGPSYYGPAYGSVYFGRGYGGGHRWHGGGGHGHGGWRGGGGHGHRHH
jgi:hypothetical protein